MGLVYITEDSKYDYSTIEKMSLDCWSQYQNISIFINRQTSRYQNYGRNQSLPEAIELDNDIKNMLISLKIPFHEVYQNEFAFEQVCNILRKENIG
jgi:hypothetical protein